MHACACAVSVLLLSQHCSCSCFGGGDVLGGGVLSLQTGTQAGCGYLRRKRDMVVS